ncbi:helix-turn-helix domain-containing protein [Enterococcus sp. AZ163]|uniref:helix-turn-helix domain-containing protein n=1 Tax=Enterococcus sp. AZ163 TaxID=2774638 RepID=UPI003D2C61A6
MYSLLKKIITEKDIHRQVSLLEQLLNHPNITAKELSQKIHTTQRTIFSDLQLIRDQLPPGWQIDSSSQGIQLINEEQQLANDLWSLFLPQSVSVQFIKSLFFTKELATARFLQENGLSLETLKRHTAKINQHLKPYHIQIKLTAKTAQLLGNESAIRIFFHRLLTPFTHNNYFFEDYAIHEEHYSHYLKQLTQSPLAIETEQIFGTCWFFINTIRLKINCRMDDFTFNKNDPLYQFYQMSLTELYQKEGVYLKEEESFFAFFCFLESWNYNNSFGEAIDLAQHYPTLAAVANQLTEQVANQTQISLQQSQLAENLLLLLLKYNESTWLSEQFQLEYQELLTERKDDDRYRSDEELLPILQPVLQLDNPVYLLNLISLLEQQALFALQPQIMTVYFIFQGEPAWKVFLQQELTDLLGRRVHLQNLEALQLQNTAFEPQDIIVSNIPLEAMPVPVVYISTIPTKNELRQLTELTLEHYL